MSGRVPPLPSHQWVRMKCSMNSQTVSGLKQQQQLSGAAVRGCSFRNEKKRERERKKRKKINRTSQKHWGIRTGGRENTAPKRLTDLWRAGKTACPPGFLETVKFFFLNNVTGFLDGLLKELTDTGSGCGGEGWGWGGRPRVQISAGEVSQLMKWDNRNSRRRKKAAGIHH